MKKIALICMFIVGCSGPEDPEVKSLNKSHLSGKGDYIGTLPDGRDITRYRIDRGNQNSHYIYIVPELSSKNTNFETGGKGSSNITTVIIDGRKFIEEK